MLLAFREQHHPNATALAKTGRAFMCMEMEGLACPAGRLQNLSCGHGFSGALCGVCEMASVTLYPCLCSIVSASSIGSRRSTGVPAGLDQRTGPCSHVGGDPSGLVAFKLVS